jgi:hypothetical protein
MQRTVRKYKELLETARKYKEMQVNVRQCMKMVENGINAIKKKNVRKSTPKIKGNVIKCKNIKWIGMFNK